MASPLSLTQQEKGINLMHIESRPSRLNNQEFEFFISVDTSYSNSLDEVIDGLRTEISGHVHELSRNKQKDTGVFIRVGVHSYPRQHFLIRKIWNWNTELLFELTRVEMEFTLILVCMSVCI